MPGIDAAPLETAQRQSFDKVADLYATARRGYPAALYEDLAAFGALGPGARVLEVGCGAGQATGDLAARAGAVVALDPGARLIEAARGRTLAANVEFVVGAFEDYAAPDGSFDLVASAQAWHWIPREVAFSRAARLLRPGGWLAVFGHVPMPVEEPFHTAFRAAFERHAPGVWGLPSPQAGYLPSGPFAGMFAESGLFEPATHRGYAWTWSLDGAGLGQYLRTDSSYHFLPETARFALFDAMAAAVEAHGGVIQAPWETHLYLARRLP